MQILGIAGSLRAGSYNRQLLGLVRSVLPLGVELVVWEGLRDVPPYDEDEEGEVPASVAELRERVHEADAVLIATPEYNGSCPERSRTRSTGPPGRSPTTSSAASRWRRSAPARGRSGPSGPRRRRARCSG